MNEYAAEVERINGNVASTYTALSEMGATMPETQNIDNLPGTVRTVPQGGGFVENAVLYTEQALTPEQQSQARQNIGASPVNIYTGPNEPTDENIQIWVNPDEEPENVPSKTVQTDWNQTDETAPDFLKNKPTRIVGGDTLVWDGNTDGLVSVNGEFFRVSDAVLSLNDVANGAFLYIPLVDQVLEIPPEAWEEYGGLVGSEGIFSVPYDNFDASSIFGDGAVFPKAGLYIPELGYEIQLVINGYTGFGGKQVIIPEALPDMFVFYLHQNDIYLHKSKVASEDNRVTMAELTAAYNSGIGWVLRSVDESVNIDFHPYITALGENVLYYFTTDSNNSLKENKYYTAEYTPPTT